MKETFASLKFSQEASLVHKTRANLPQQSKEFDKQTKRVNSDIIIKAGVINPINCTALRSTERAPCSTWFGILQSTMPQGKINSKCFHKAICVTMRMHEESFMSFFRVLESCAVTQNFLIHF